MVESIPWKRFRFVLLVTLTIGLSCCLGGSAEAVTGGSWGSSVGGSGGSWGSGGSVGGRGGLLGRLGGRVSGGSGGSMGSAGSTGSTGSLGSSGGSRGGLLRGGLFRGGLLGRRASGSTGGWSGSSGGWSSTGSSGSTGSTGSFASTGSYASTGSGYASSSNGAIYGGWGASYLGTLNSSLETSYSVPSYPMGGYAVEESYPVGDYGFSNSYPIEGGMIMDASPILDGGSIDSMIDSAPIEGFVPAGEYYQTPVAPATGTETPAGEQPPGPVNEDSTSVEPENNNQVAQTASVLTLVLPEDAKVFINDRLTTTPGAKRSYRSSHLVSSREYKYRVKAVLTRNGNEIVRSELVTMKPGLDKIVQFDFEGNATQTVAKIEADAAVVTKLALKVPADAKVILCGNQTKRMGTIRTFETNSLKPGKIWKGYKVEVEFERDGKLVKEERLLDMVGGQSYTLAIGVDESKDRVAAN